MVLKHLIENDEIGNLEDMMLYGFIENMTLPDVI